MRAPEDNRESIRKEGHRMLRSFAGAILHELTGWVLMIGILGIFASGHYKVGIAALVFGFGVMVLSIFRGWRKGKREKE